MPWWQYLGMCAQGYMQGSDDIMQHEAITDVVACAGCTHMLMPCIVPAPQSAVAHAVVL